MVSLIQALTAALKVGIYTIFFWIIGIILISMGLQNSLNNNLINSPNLSVAQFLIFIGLLTIILGNLAAFMKVFTELIINETKTNKQTTKNNNITINNISIDDYNKSNSENNKGIDFINKQNYDAAIKSFTNAINLDSNN
ncbi:MAG: hypothetical protein KAS30_01230, partial [Candidatus Diapherotrites archaeon]|nr:hypothetical protein [Candidatus Diapherotrites archaeon]